MEEAVWTTVVELRDLLLLVMPDAHLSPNAPGSRLRQRNDLERC